MLTICRDYLPAFLSHYFLVHADVGVKWSVHNHTELHDYRRCGDNDDDDENLVLLQQHFDLEAE